MNQRLNDYIKQATQGVPASEREQESAELHQHLTGLIKRHEEEGQTPSQAVESAVRDFGSARTLRSQMRRAYSRQRWQALRPYFFGVDSVPFAFTIAFGIKVLTDIPLDDAYNALFRLLQPGYEPGLVPLDSALTGIIRVATGLLSFLMGVICGLITAKIAPKRARFGLSLLTAIYLVPSIPVMYQVLFHPSPEQDIMVVPVYLMLALTLPIGLFLGTWLARQIHFPHLLQKQNNKGHAA